VYLVFFAFNDILFTYKKRIPKEIVWLIWKKKNRILLKSVFRVCVFVCRERDVGAHHNSISHWSIDVF
jgi:hypothetical protein